MDWAASITKQISRRSSNDENEYALPPAEIPIESYDIRFEERAESGFSFTFLRYIKINRYWIARYFSV